MKKRLLLLSLLLALLAQAGCISISTPGSNAILTPAPNVSATPDSNVNGQDSNGCPTATTDEQVLTNSEDGYCFLYPSEFTPKDPPLVLILNPVSGPGDIPGDAWIHVTVDPADGRTAAQVAEAEIGDSAGMELNIERTDITLGGEPAVVVDGLPGPDPWRKMFVVHGDRLYTWIFMPWVPDAQNPTPLETLYESIVSSLRFLPPSRPLPTPTVPWSPGNQPPPLTFEYPVDGQTLDYEGDYLFKVTEVLEAEAYFWSFSQNGVVVWENLRDDKGLTSGGTYLIAKDTEAHSRFVPGPVEVTVRAVKGEFYADPTVITINLE